MERARSPRAVPGTSSPGAARPGSSAALQELMWVRLRRTRRGGLSSGVPNEPWSRLSALRIGRCLGTLAHRAGRCMSPSCARYAYEARHRTCCRTSSGHRLRHATLPFSSEEIVRPDVGTPHSHLWRLNGPCFLPPQTEPATSRLLPLRARGKGNSRPVCVSPTAGTRTPPAGRPLMLRHRHRHRHRTRTSPPRRLGLPTASGITARDRPSSPLLFVNTIHFAS